MLCNVAGGPWGCDKAKGTGSTLSGDITPQQQSVTGSWDDNANALMPITFAFDSHELERPEMNRVADWLSMAMELGANEIVLYGYADEVGSPEYNKALSLKRANAVEAALRTFGYEGRIELRAMGSCCFLTGGESTDSRLNRRVELQLKTNKGK